MNSFHFSDLGIKINALEAGMWKRKLEAVNGYRFRFHLRCSTILALNVFLTQNKQLKHTITRVCEASCCRKYPLLNSQKFESTAVC